MLLLGILQGILLAALASVLILLIRAARPHVAFLGVFPAGTRFPTLNNHPENEPLPHAFVFRPESNLIYVNAETVLQAVLDRVEAGSRRSEAGGQRPFGIPA